MFEFTGFQISYTVLAIFVIILFVIFSEWWMRR